MFGYFSFQQKGLCHIDQFGYSLLKTCQPRLNATLFNFVCSRSSTSLFTYFRVWDYCFFGSFNPIAYFIDSKWSPLSGALPDTMSLGMETPSFFNSTISWAFILFKAFYGLFVLNQRVVVSIIYGIIIPDFDYWPVEFYHNIILHI